MLNAVANNLAMPLMVPEINQTWPLLISKDGSGAYLPKRTMLGVPEKRSDLYSTVHKKIGYDTCELWEKGVFIDMYV